MFKKLGLLGTITLMFISFGLGMFVQDVVLARWSCIHGKVQSQVLVYDDPRGAPGRLITVGEQVLCAKDWRITNVYGPKLPTEYKFNKYTPKPEWIPFYKYFTSGSGDAR